jgi:hypothetical protein
VPVMMSDAFAGIALAIFIASLTMLFLVVP